MRKLREWTWISFTGIIMTLFSPLLLAHSVYGGVCDGIRISIGSEEELVG